MGATGSSDAHDPSVVGCYYTDFPAPIDDFTAFIAALKNRLGRPGCRPDGPLASGPI